jgi:large subunit ribosomal protein L13
MRQRRPERILEYAIRGMLPKTKLGRAMFRKLKIYTAGSHPHTAQQPEPLVFSA